MNTHVQTGSSPDMRKICRIDAIAAADHRGVLATPASLLAEPSKDGWRIVAIGRPGEVDRHRAAPHAMRTTCRAVLLPGLVNAHTHLDLTHIGAVEHDPDRGFVPWIDAVRTARHGDDEAIARSVSRGARLVRAGGTVAVGDVAGHPQSGPTLAPLRTLRSSGLQGVSFMEYFAIGTARDAAPARLESFLREHAEEIDRPGPMRFGLMPHAPNTVALGGYRWGLDVASRRGWPLCTHLAETIEERLFIGQGTGPLRDLLESIGRWDSSVLDDIGHGASPVEHLAPVLTQAPWLLAHVNDADDRAIDTLASCGARVVYCPRASGYFGAHTHFGPHRYRDMLEAGIPVALGTDSIVNLPSEAADRARGGISILDEMRFLHRRDGTDARTLLTMGTIHGADALGLDKRLFQFDTGNTVLGIARVDVDVPDGAREHDILGAVLEATSPATLWSA